MLSKKGKKLEFLLILLLIGLGVGLRFLPHPPNFAPIAAIALFGGVYLSKKLALILPILALGISDLFLGYYEIPLMISVYGSFLLCVSLGFWLKKNKKWPLILGSSLLSAVLFFLITNFVVWAFTPWYAKTFSGLIRCFLLALPFFKNTISGNLFYTTCFFGTYQLVDLWIKKKFKLPYITLTPTFSKELGIRN